jgi:hypothetical protein
MSVYRSVRLITDRCISNGRGLKMSIYYSKCYFTLVRSIDYDLVREILLTIRKFEWHRKERKKIRLSFLSMLFRYILVFM